MPNVAPLRTGRLIAILALLVLAAGAAAALLPQGLVRWAVLGVIAVPAAVILIDRPQWLFYIFLFVLLSNIQIFFPFRLFRSVLVFLVAALLANVAAGRRLTAGDPVFMFLAAAFLLIAFQSTAFAVDIDAAFWRLGLFARVLLNVLIVIQFVRSRREMLLTCIVIVAAVLLSSLLPLAVPPPADQATRSLIWDVGVLRYEGYVGEANFFAFHQVFFTPLLLFLFARFARPRIVRPLLLAALAATVYVSAMSFSRGGFVSLLIMLAMLLVVERHNRILLVTGGTLAGFLAFATPAIYWSRIASLFDAARDFSLDHAVLARFEMMKVALLIGARHLLFGVGINNFIYQSTRYIPYGKNVHNAFLQIFAELGLPGIAVLIALFVWNFRLVRRMMRARGDEEAALLGRMLLLQQIGVAINVMFIPAAYDIVFWLSLALPSVARYAYFGSGAAARR